MSAKRILDGRDVLNNGAAAGMYGIQVTPQGTAFILTGSYSADYGTFTSRVLKIAMRDLLGGNAAQNLVTVAEYENAGYSWDILFDNSASTLWVMTGKEIEARDIDGKLLKTFSPFSLGDNAYTIALLEGAWVEYPELEPIEPNLPNTPGNNTPENNTPENNITAPVFIEATDESVSSFKDNTGIPVSVVEVAGTKQVVVDEDYAREAVKSVYSGSAEVTEIISLPAFRADAGGKEFVTVGYSLKGVSFLADYAKDASLLKILPDRKAAAYTYDASGTGGDGTFRILKDGNDYTGPLEAADIYDLALTLEDNGPYDLDKTTANTVLDPMIIARVAPVTGGSGGESGGGTGDGGGGGGCASGLGGGALLPVPFLLRLLKRSSRRRLRAIILKLKERKKRKEEGEQDEGQEKHDER
jgi:hypothetical protein